MDVFESNEVSFYEWDSPSHDKDQNVYLLKAYFENQYIKIVCSNEKELAAYNVCIQSKESCVALGISSFVINNKYMLTFAQISDSISFDSFVKKIFHLNKNVFTNRTDDTSAVQYFQFYSYLYQQQNMMQDYVRTSTYYRAVHNNPSNFKDKVVVDVGTGSGILAFFAAQAGARKVYAIEASSMANHAKTLVKANGLGDIIEVICAKVEEVDLPESVDMIISEPLGYMLLNERMIESFLHAKKWLTSEGRMFPSCSDLYIAPFNDELLYHEQFTKSHFWLQDSFFGVNLSSLKEESFIEHFKQPIVDTFHISICVAAPIKHHFDFKSLNETDLHNIKIPLNYVAATSSLIHGLAFWFDSAFIGSEATIWLSTAPNQNLTHWYQVRCLFRKPLFVYPGQLLNGFVILKSNSRQSYDIEMELSNSMTAQVSTNCIDLKNPYFRFTGAPVQPPPSHENYSPTDLYYASNPNLYNQNATDTNAPNMGINGQPSTNMYRFGDPNSPFALGFNSQYYQQQPSVVDGSYAMPSEYSNLYTLSKSVSSGQQNASTPPTANSISSGVPSYMPRN